MNKKEKMLIATMNKSIGYYDYYLSLQEDLTVKLGIQPIMKRLKSMNI